MVGAWFFRDGYKSGPDNHLRKQTNLRRWYAENEFGAKSKTRNPELEFANGEREPGSRAGVRAQGEAFRVKQDIKNQLRVQLGLTGFRISIRINIRRDIVQLCLKVKHWPPFCSKPALGSHLSPGSVSPTRAATKRGEIFLSIASLSVGKGWTRPSKL